VLVEHASTNTKRLTCVLPATITLQAALRNSSRSVAPNDLFSAPSKPLDSSGDRRLAYLRPDDSLQKAEPLAKGKRWSFLQVAFQ
jgi:hypothetical protein